VGGQLVRRWIRQNRDYYRYLRSVEQVGQATSSRPDTDRRPSVPPKSPDA